jgi:type VI secretion system secreted protein VgrG
MSDDPSTPTVDEQAVLRVTSSNFDPTVLKVRDFVARESMGQPFVIEVQLIAGSADLSLTTVLGTHLTLEMDLSNAAKRYFDGIVTRFTYIGEVQGGFAYQATLRPWFWLLKRNIQTRIYQSKTVPDIIKAVFNNADFDDFDDKTSRSPYRTLDYCVQYQESDFDFVHRLMEQEGIYYFFKHQSGLHKLVLADGDSSHATYDNFPTISYASADTTGGYAENVTSWIATQEIQSGKFTIRDRDFEKPSANLEKVKAISDVSSYGSFEIYEWPGKYTEADDGTTYAGLRMEEQRAKFARALATTSARFVATGCLVTLSDAPRSDLNAQYLILDTLTEWSIAGGQGLDTSFHVMPKAHVYRMPRTTPKPYIRGPQTALVTGKSGEEIWTDKYARVKVQFYWDRYGNKDESSSCWIRTAQPWAGKSWGTVFVPRIGQEVVVHFLEGDPDQPIITGAVYNGPDDQPSPITLPDNATQSTIKTNSSKGGGGFNQIRFEDKAGSEELFVQAQKDYNITVLNNRAITVTQDLTETVNKGNRSITVKQGNETKEISQGNQSLKVAQGNQTIEVTQGNRSLTVSQGKETVTVNGDQSITIQTGNHSVTVSAGTCKITSPQSITLQVGANSVVIDTSGVTIKGMNVTVQGEMATKMSGLTVDVEGSGQTTVKGAMVMVN